MKKNKKTFDKLFYNNKFVLAFSVFLAVVFWAAVKINYSDNTTRMISDVKITLDTSFAKENDFVAFVDSDKLTVDVEVSGKSYAINSKSFSKDNITVEASSGYIDSAGYKVINLSAKSSESDVTVVGIYPSTITVFYDRKTTQTFNVEAKLNNKLDTLVEDGYSVGQPVASLSTVDVSGPATVVEKIKKVYFEATLDENNLPLEATREVTAQVSFDLENERGSQFLVCDSLSQEANTATITIPVSKVKTVPTTVKFINEPKAFEENPPRVSIYPSEIEISYNPLDDTDYESFNVGTIDFKELTSGLNTFEFKPDDKSVVNIVDPSITKFTVRVNLYSQSQTTVDATGAKTVFLNQADGYNYSVNLDTGELDSVKIIGPKAQIDKITPDMLQIEINVSSIDPEKTSSQTVEISNISIQSDYGNSCWVSGKYKAFVKVSKKQ
ncbi:MAG: YbbR-like domain-containing protein [Acutalibacteraceae bacterium]